MDLSWLHPTYCLINCYLARYLYLEDMQLLPWGGKITSESLKFFSPIVIWTIFESTEHNHHVLHSAFVDYYKARPDYFFKFSQKV